MIENRLAAFLLGSTALLFGGTTYLLRTETPSAPVAVPTVRTSAVPPSPSATANFTTPVRPPPAVPPGDARQEPSIAARNENYPPARLIPSSSVPPENETPFVEDFSPASITGEKPFAPAPVNSRARGNGFVFHGMRVAVAERLAEDRHDRPTLGIDVTPENGETPSAMISETSPPPAANEAPDSSTDDPTKSGSEKSNPGDPADVSAEESGNPTARRSRLQVFTAEENAFRARWGWEAFDLMRREAAQAAANP